MERKRFSQDIPRNLFNFDPQLLKKGSLNWQISLKKINANEDNKLKSTLKLITSSSKFYEKSSTSNLDQVKEKTNSPMQTAQSDQCQKFFNLTKTSHLKHRSKGVKFHERSSIQTRESIHIRKQSILTEILNEQRISMLQKSVKNNNLNLPIAARRNVKQNEKIVSDLVFSPVQSKSSVIEEIKCFMCHYPDQNSVLLGKKVISSVKERLLQISKLQYGEQTFFRYEAFGHFLKVLNDQNYDSLQVINAYETVLNKYTYPINVKLMLYYLGSYLYQLNNLYDRSEEVLRKMCEELLKLKLYEYVGVYLILMVKMKANLLEWDLCASYLMKLLAYAWLYKFQNLEIWVYFELSRSYFFLNQPQESQYFKTRSEMSIIQPSTNIYRELVAKNFTDQLNYMRTQHKSFNLDRKIATCELTKLDTNPSNDNIKGRDDFKLQTQIKTINEHCKIRHVKNLLYRMNSSQEAKSYFNHSRDAKLSSQFAGNPLLRTHESGLKNLNIYFRHNPRGQSLINKNRQPKLYTFENSNKNILVIKELCRNILLQMKQYVPINANES